MGAAGDLRPYQRVFRVKIRGIDSLEPVPSDVVISVSGRSFKVCFADMRVLHSLYDPELVIFRRLIDLPEALREPVQYRRCVIKYLIRNTEPAVN